MGNAPVTQLAFVFGGAGSEPAPLFVPKRSLAKHRSCGQVLARLLYVRRFFPELGEKSIRVGLTRVASGMAIPGGAEIWFNPSRTSYHTIAHELVHLLQNGGGIPGGERSCDLFSLARHWTLNDTLPSYLRVPPRLADARGRTSPAGARLLYEAAGRAIDLRREGVRNYIAYFERTIEDLGSSAAYR